MARADRGWASSFAAQDSDFARLAHASCRVFASLPLPSRFKSPQKWQPLIEVSAILGLQSWVDILAALAVALSVCFLATQRDRDILTDRPMQTIVLGSAAVGFSVILLHLALRLVLPVVRGDGYDAVREYELSDNASEGPKPRELAVPAGLPWSGRRQLGVACLIILALSSRLFILQFLVRYKQCTVSGVEGASLLILGFLGSYGTRHAEHGGSRRLAMYGGLRDLLPVSFILGAYISASRLVSWPRSTFICPEADATPAQTVLRQLGSTTLDAVVLAGWQALLPRLSWRRSSKLRNSVPFLGVSMLLSSLIVFGIGLVTYVIPRFDSFLKDLDDLYINSLAQSCVCFVALVSCLDHLLLSGKARYFLASVALALILIGIQRGSWNQQWATPNSDLTSALLPVVLVILGLASQVNKSSTRPGLGGSGRLTRSLLNLSSILLLFFLGWRAYGWTSSTSYEIHPIDDLMEIAEWDHNKWREQALISKSLAQATAEYRARYIRLPPPGFDAWYEYASQRNSVVIDDFDSIEEDLSLFWAVSPQELRERSKLAVSDEWNEVAEVQIRSGKAGIGQVIPTHRWMVEGITKMIEAFAEYLPDMDVAFNINDEARVAIPYPDLVRLQDLSRAALDRNKPDGRGWSPNRGESLSFNAADVKLPLKNIFENHSFTKTLRRFGSISCPPSSLAHRYPSWDDRILCAPCAAPHSFGLILSNWSHAASPCHQPDLSSQHGFYLSPSAYKPTRHLMPVFSQSRPGGYQDVRYPSAWNYADKVSYAPSETHLDPPWATKANTLFWRGSTTEGFSEEGSGSWMGMARQRLVHLANNGSRALPALLAAPRDPDRFTYQTMTGPALPDHPSLRSHNFAVDVQLTPRATPCDSTTGECIARCYGADCLAQAREFGPGVNASGIDFQDHWRHRFLLDADGAGFSGRFLPFLRSRSLPFKTAVFREWHDARVAAWRHFVPLDIRLQGLWSTVAYFAGGYGGKGRDPRKAGPRDPGERIAEEGRAWAAKALRKEDMEIYFFRLLLEWGRLTDDRRDELGFWTE